MSNRSNSDPRYRRPPACRSLDYLWHEKEAVFSHGRVGKHLIGDAAVGDDIVAHRKSHWNHRSHRLDALDIDLFQGLDEFQDRVDFVLQVRKLGLVHSDARQTCDTANSAEIDGHRRLPKARKMRRSPYTSRSFCAQTRLQSAPGPRRSTRPACRDSRFGWPLRLLSKILLRGFRSTAA